MKDNNPYTEKMEEFFNRIKEGRPIARYMCSTQDLVENQIRQAYAEGKFDNLKGAGEPLDLRENPYESPEDRLVNKILSNNNFAPYWIEIGKAIDAEEAAIVQLVEKFGDYLEIRRKKDSSYYASNEYKYKYREFNRKLMVKLEKIYDMVLNYNLACPISRLQRVHEKPEKLYADICRKLGI